jgi:hypothetical protein
MPELQGIDDPGGLCLGMVYFQQGRSLVVLDVYLTASLQHFHVNEILTNTSFITQTSESSNFWITDMGAFSLALPTTRACPTLEPPF